MKALLGEDEVLKQFKTELNKASEFRIGMALITASGVGAVQQWLERCLGKGGQGSVLVGIDLPTEPDAIERLCALEKRFKKNFRLRRFQSDTRFFHPKLSVFVTPNGTKTAIVGSSNLTRGGLGENFEANIFLDDGRVVQALLDYFDEHFQGGHSKSVDPIWLREYRRLWIERRKANQRLRHLREKARTLRPALPLQKIPKRIKGFVFAFTGGIPDWPRLRVLYPRVKLYEGSVERDAGSIARASCLVHADIAGGRDSTKKLIRARDLNIPIITQDEFLKILLREARLRRH